MQDAQAQFNDQEPALLRTACSILASHPRRMHCSGIAQVLAQHCGTCTVRLRRMQLHMKVDKAGSDGIAFHCKTGREALRWGRLRG